ncbi:uncharacterized protein DS421_7g213060 [Arachis hypogaea]|nr:uncharacterized protein DS421_7g213060 [Arachis hypogaea]
MNESRGGSEREEESVGGGTVRTAITRRRRLALSPSPLGPPSLVTPLGPPSRHRHY